MLQLEISRLRTQLTALNSKLLEKCKDSVELETEAISNNSEMVDLKEYAFNSLKSFFFYRVSPCLYTNFDRIRE